MNLYFFPEAPTRNNGYGLAVLSDFEKLSPSKNDIIIWYTNNINHELIDDTHIYISKPKYISFKRLKHVIKNEVSTEITKDQINICNTDIEEIFCGDVIGYRALRKLYPKHKITVRFHNCFSRIKNRIEILNTRLSNIRFRINLNSLSRLEMEIFRDLNCEKIFITQEDLEYYVMMTGRKSDAKLWPFLIDIDTALKHQKEFPHNKITKLVWFGGAESHKRDSILWFRDFVFPHLQKIDEKLEFHLWGKNTEYFKCKNSKVFAHGFYQEYDFPLKNEALYVNPDLIGGGVKTKLKTYYENGIPFITTPFGFEGYPKNLIDNQFCIVSQPEDWIETIHNHLIN